jgi:hypothetical protein
MANPLTPDDIDYWRQIDASDPDSMGRLIKWSDLRSGTDADSDLRVRCVLKMRMMAKTEQIKGKYLTNFPFCVRDNGDGTFTVFDGNHRFHAIGYWIKKGTLVPNNIYTEDFKVPCVVYRKEIPVELALQYATLTNDMQRCAAGGTAMDFLRFIKNIRIQLSAQEGYVRLHANAHTCIDTHVTHTYQGAGDCSTDQGHTELLLRGGQQPDATDGAGKELRVWCAELPDIYRRRSFRRG